MKLVVKKTKFRSFFKKLMLLAVIGLPVSVNAQTLDWAKQIGGAFSDSPNSIARDGAGNIYTTGSFAGTVDFDPGVGVFNLTSAGLYDIFISKLDASGNFVWAKQMGGSNNDEGMCIKIDENGNIYTTGHFLVTGDFDPGAATFNLTSSGYWDIFISKLDASGNFVWAKSFSGPAAYDNSTSLVVDASGNVYTTGYFGGTVDFDPGANTFSLTSSGDGDIFISKLDAAGNFMWAKQMGAAGSASDQGNAIVLDNLGNVYTTGGFQGTVDFDPGVGTFNFTSVGDLDAFILKLDAFGDFVWAKQMGGVDYNDANSIALDGTGNIYTAGSFLGTVDFDPGTGIVDLTSAGSSDVFISKLDASGNLLWVKQMGGTTNDAGISIAVDGTGNVYTTGFFQGTADFNPGAGTFNLISAGDFDVYISSLDDSGNFVGAVSIGGTNADFGHSIAIDGSGNIYTTGSFMGTADFDPKVGTFNLTSAGNNDVFVLKLAPCVSSTGTDVISACGSHTWIDGHTYNANNYSATWTLTNMYGCDSVVTLNLTIDNINSNIIAVGNIIYAADDNLESYQWIDCDNNQSIPGATSYTYQVGYSGNFALVATNGVCVDTSVCVYMNVTGIAELQKRNVSVYPNPVTDVLNISIDGNNKIEQIEIQDCIGRVVHQSVFSEQLDLVKLTPGFYYLNLRLTNNATEVIKIIKQ